MSKDLSRLAALAAMIRETELAKLAALAADRRRGEQRISDLRARQAMVAERPGFDEARISGADMLWLGWASDQLQCLSGEAVNAAARTEAQLVIARRAFRRADVLNTLAKNNSKAGAR